MRVVNGLWPYMSSRGRRPLGSRMARIQSAGRTSPTVNVLPPMTMFERRCALSWP